MKRVIVIGGGLGGLVTAIQLVRAGIPCIVIEKKAYPFHRVCGEYISNEIVPFLKSIDLYPGRYNPPAIKRFQLSAIDGKSKTMPLDLGGFGISRFTFDNYLYERAKDMGVMFHLQEEVQQLVFKHDVFHVKTALHEWEAEVVIGAYGKRSRIDHFLNRKFMAERSPYLGVKYHIRTTHPDDLIALHNFPGGYCGMSNIEDGKTTLCYLSHRRNLKESGTIKDMEERVLFRNPILRSVFNNSEFLFMRPEVINEISFATKSPVENHILMTGDAAGMIAPLCGNGMAMAMQSARLLSEQVIQFVKGENFPRHQLEQNYTELWNGHFRGRLWRGRQIQKLFGREFTSRLAVSLVMNIKPLAETIIRNTHGEVF